MGITLMIPQQFFNKDFLEIELKKQMGVRGDTLIQHFRGGMQEIHKHNRNSKLFSDKMFYMCKAVNGNVVLTGAKIK